jgi:hypothetical protein
MCLPNWTGPDCNLMVNKCLDRPCKNGGRCTTYGVHGNYFRCFCPPGFTGLDCAISVVIWHPSPIYYFYYPCFSSTLYAKMPLVGPINAAHHWKTATAAFATPASRALTVDFGKHLEKTMTGKLQPNMTVVFVSLTDFANNFTPISFPRKRQSH